MFSLLSLGINPKNLETNFRKMKEDFINSEPNHKNLSVLLHMCHGLEYLHVSLHPIFYI
jgi:hypothetical protein